MKAIFVLLASVLIAMNASAADITAGAAKAKEICAACHGADGNSTDPNNPKLAGQHRDYIAKALRDYKTGDRTNPIMKGFAAALTKQDIENLAAHFSSQTSTLNFKY